MKKFLLFLSILLLPINTYAYSNYIYRGGNTLGIEIDCDGVLIVGFYQIDGKFNKGNPELKVGELTAEIEKHVEDKEVEITYKRNNKESKTTLPLVSENNVYKTGLYVKDSITGIGTLTYIDPSTNIYGALGHEVIESNSKKIVEIKTGNIFRNSIVSIDKSMAGYAGSKNAKYYYNTIFGNILKNTNHGIFGLYKQGINNLKLVEVGKPEDIKIGKATIYTVLNGENVEEFEININRINETSNTKNLTFEITDKKLLEKTGGVIQGMSGSPIMQNNKIIGVVTHVIVDNPVTGYGLFITKMLEEGES